jgi:putative transposase
LRGGSPDREHTTDAQVVTLMRAIHAEVRCAYGSPRMYDELRARGFRVGKTRVERLMREHGIRARHKRRFKATTDSKHSLPIAANVLERNFSPEAPNRVWTADLTYVWTDEGWLYLAVVLDLFNREVVGWAIKPRMSSDIVFDALTMAWFRRRPEAGLIHHSDHGSQYLSIRYTTTLSAAGVNCSAGTVGDSYDNALAETVIGLYKAELVRRHGPWRSVEQLELATLEWVDWYNQRRLHSWCGHIPPAEYEAIYYNQHRPPDEDDGMQRS